MKVKIEAGRLAAGFQRYGNEDKGNLGLSYRLSQTDAKIAAQKLAKVDPGLLVKIKLSHPVIPFVPAFQAEDPVTKDATDWAPIMGGPGSQQAPFIKAGDMAPSATELLARFRDDEGGGP